MPSSKFNSHKELLVHSSALTLERHKKLGTYFFKNLPSIAINTEKNISETKLRTKGKFSDT